MDIEDIVKFLRDNESDLGLVFKDRLLAMAILDYGNCNSVCIAMCTLIRMLSYRSVSRGIRDIRRCINDLENSGVLIVNRSFGRANIYDFKIPTVVDFKRHRCKNG